MLVIILLIALALWVDISPFLPNKQQRDQNKRDVEAAGQRARERLARLNQMK